MKTGLVIGTVLCLFSANLHAATLINANFETSTGATLANDNTNKWCRGTATAFSGSYSLYISDNNCVSNQYTGALATNVSHAYWIVNFPAGETNIVLSFNWRCMGEAGYDDLRVFYQLTNPTAGVEPSGTLIGTFLGQSTWQTANLSLPTSLAGQSGVRIVFSWRNDWNLGTEPPAAIDNVLLTTAAPAVGANCSNPIVVSSFPYNHSGNSAGMMNDYGIQSSCGGNYGGGEDVVFRLNIPSAGTATFNLTNTSGTQWIGMFLKSSADCASTGTSLACAVSGGGNTANFNYFFPSSGTYFLIVDYWPSPNNSLYNLSIAFSATIANDECSGAILLTPGTSCSGTTGTVSGATASSGIPSCVGTPNDDVWYRFTATSDRHNVQVSGSSNFDAVVQVLSGTCGNLTSLVCRDASLAGGTETATLTGLTIGNTYYVRVYDYYSGTPSTPTFTVCVTTPTPTNDECSSAIVLTPGVACTQTSGTTAGATASSGIPSCVGTPNNDVWYRFTATSNQHIINVEGESAFDAVVQAFSGSCGSLTSIGCRDAGYSGDEETLILSGLNVGQTYFIRVYHYYSSFPTTPGFKICVTTNVAGANCFNPIVVGPLPYTHSGSTSATGNSYGTQSCSSSYGGGNDVVYRLDASVAGRYNVTVTNTSGTGWIGWFAKADGLCSNTSSSVACAVSGNGNTAAGSFDVAEPGTYYIVIDYWPAPSSSNYSINITRTNFIEGATCSSARIRTAPFSDTGTTCGSANDYGSFCGGFYGGGEDFVYRITIPNPGEYFIHLNNVDNTNWVTAVLKSVCDGPCLLNLTSSAGSVASGSYSFSQAGNYYLFIDSWPSPNCFNYSLTVSLPPAVVWPGDADNDGTVTAYDLFLAAGGYGQTGPARTYPGSNWQGYAAGQLWNTQTLYRQTTVNNVYLDANGDGVINLFDVALTVQHRGNSR